MDSEVTKVKGRFLALAALSAVGCMVALSAHAQDDDTSGRGRKYKEPPPVSHIVVTVVRGHNNKPVDNAAVIFHTIHDGKDQGNMEIKTNEDGVAKLDVIPIGDQVQLQVFKMGFQTYGQNFVNVEATHNLTVRLQAPTGQFSTYQSAPVGDPGSQSTTPQATQGASKAPNSPH